MTLARAFEFVVASGVALYGSTASAQTRPTLEAYCQRMKARYYA